MKCAGIALVQTHNPSTQEAEAAGFLIQDHTGLYKEMVSQNSNKKQNDDPCNTKCGPQ